MSINVVIGQVDQDLIDDFFADDLGVTRSQATCLEELAVEQGLFPSKGTARKNGFAGVIPAGIHLLGTKKKRFWVWCHPAATTDTAKTCDTRCRCTSSSSSG